VRYWAASTGLGKDAVINEERIQAGSKLVTKLWHVARFSGRFMADHDPSLDEPAFTPADRWILARTQTVIMRCTRLWRRYDYATAKSEVELFFWRDLADNYLEMVKRRLYDDSAAAGARFALYESLLATIKLLAPILPHVTERIYQALFATQGGSDSIHRAPWPEGNMRWLDDAALNLGETLRGVATAVRRYKSEQNLSLGVELAELYLATADPRLAAGLQAAEMDLLSITRAGTIQVGHMLPTSLEKIGTAAGVEIALRLG
jgi:valyl-tRNA synthetase